MLTPCIKPDCLDPNSVLSNLSAEAPDQQVCRALVSGVTGFARKMMGPGKNFGANDCIEVCDLAEGTDPFACAFNAYVCALNSNFVCQDRSGDGPPATPSDPAGAVPPGGGGFGGAQNLTKPKPTPDPTPTAGGGPSLGNGTTPGGVAPIFGNNLQTCSVPCPDGTKFTWVVASGFFLAGSQAQADRMAANYACLKAGQQRICLFGVLPDACSLAPYSGQISISGSNPPYTMQVTGGSLPPGLSLVQSDSNAQIFNLQGTPASGGNFTFQVTATDANGNFAAKTFQISIFEITTKTLPNATFGGAYSAQLQQNGGAVPLWSIVKGSLPQELGLDPHTGIISGTCWVCVPQTFTVRMEDQLSGAACTQDLTITPVCPPINWNNLVWGAPFINVNPPGTGSASGSGSGAFFGVSATSSVPSTMGPGFQAQAQISGSMVFTGGGGINRLKVSAAISGPASQTTGQVQVFQGGIIPPLITVDFPGGGNTIFTLVGPFLATSFAVLATCTAYGNFGIGAGSIGITGEMQPNH